MNLLEQYQELMSSLNDALYLNGNYRSDLDPQHKELLLAALDNASRDVIRLSPFHPEPKRKRGAL